MPRVPNLGDPLIYKRLGVERASSDEAGLLLEAGWGPAFDAAAREAYEVLFAGSPAFETKWGPIHADLTSPHAADRLRGLELILKAACEPQQWLWNPRVTEALLELLRTAEGVALEKAGLALVRILGPFPDRRAHGACLPLLTHPLPRIRASAVWSVGLSGGAGAWSDVLPLISDGIAEVRQAALSSLSNGYSDLPEEGRAQLQSAAIAALKDRVDGVRLAAVAMLGSIGDTASLQALADIKPRRMVWREAVNTAIAEILKRAASTPGSGRERSASRKGLK
ncbi:MAG: HEAT repeat domain-containing protein [Acidobacteria bacterium]|nr:HEAT repeat domain-containing protein [Acidobacteriota bacterium]MBI3487148.1 HEAT repeat domain-containing protein [Acidobacteriota bacterium]